jgi:DNA-binding GntR family transcriptional regulator
MIEPQAAAAATRSISRKELSALQAQMARLESYQGEGDELHWAFDDALHETIAEKSGNPFLARTILEMRRYTKIFERQMIPTQDKPGIEDHRKIMAAFASGRADAVREAMAEHIKNVRKRVLNGL